MNAAAQALKGHLDVLLLATLEGGPLHGYAVKEALREGSGGRFDLPTGTIYPALHRLAEPASSPVNGPQWMDGVDARTGLRHPGYDACTRIEQTGKDSPLLSPRCWSVSHGQPPADRRLPRWPGWSTVGRGR
jgi:hypothetical protein